MYAQWLLFGCSVMSSAFPLSIEEKLVLLTGLWCSIIQGDHHKDRDCHWSIVTKYSYGEGAKYFVEHSGYVHADVYEQYSDYHAAQLGLRFALEKAIGAEYAHAKTQLTGPDEWDAQSALRTIELVDQSQLIDAQTLNMACTSEI
jgi:hypothetical protein